jgi:hypothetical protein
MATHPSADAPVAEFAGQLFFRLWRASHTRAADVLGSIGLTPALFGLLNVIGAREGDNQQELGLAMGIDRSTMVLLIDELESADMAIPFRIRRSNRGAKEARAPREGSHPIVFSVRPDAARPPKRSPRVAD